MKKRIGFTVFIFICLTCLPSYAQMPWEFKRTYESQTLIKSPFFLFVAADINKNGVKELIVTDFGQTGNHVEEWKQWKEDFYSYSLVVLEWEKSELKTNFKKHWTPSTLGPDGFMAYESHQLVPWSIQNRVIAETIPAYVGIEWQNGKYMLHEQQGPDKKKSLIGSWVFPWISPSCYQGFPNMQTWPMECLVAIRDFSGKGEPKIFSIVEDKIGFNQYKQTLRVRKFGAGFPIEWEKESPFRFVMRDPIDRLNYKSTSPILLRVFRTAKWHYFEPEEHGKGYRLRDLHLDGARGPELYDFFDFYLRKTKSKKIEEFWGYRRVELNDPESINFIIMLRNASLKPDLSAFLSEDIDFQHHGNFLGVGFFVVEDVDSDGLDEIILVEQSAGKLTFGHETVDFGDVKDYVHILKWDGNKYRTMWVSQPYTKRGTKVLVDDIKNTGKKQLVVLAPYGNIEIWERQ